MKVRKKLKFRLVDLENFDQGNVDQLLTMIKLINQGD